jgi:hypothetical protein
MTSFSEAKAKGLKWPAGPDDLSPSKQANTYLYAGGRTRKLKILLAEVYAAWYLSIIALDRYLYKNRAFKKQNWFLENVCMHSSAYFLHSFGILFIMLPATQWAYWKILYHVVGVVPKSRDPLPNWKEGEGLEH